MKRSLKLLVLAALIALPVSAQLIVQPPTILKQPSICSDKVVVTAFSVSPSNPAPDAAVTVEMAIKNNCTSTINIPWRLARNDQVLGQDTLYNVAAGATAVVKSTWTAYAGNHHFYGDADPNNTLADSQRSNNIAASDVSIAALMDRLRMDAKRAMNAGARLTAKLLNPGVCGSYTDVTETHTVTFRLNCSYTGNRTENEAFTTATGSHFTLKNGWKIERWEVTNDSTCWSWLSGAPGPPPPGQNDTYMKIRLWAEPMGSCYAHMNLHIIGPKGTDPYICQLGYDCNTGLKN